MQAQKTPFPLLLSSYFFFSQTGGDKIPHWVLTTKEDIY